MNNNEQEENRQITKVTEPDDPRRCQTNISIGQCLNVAVPGGQNCMIHGGNKQLDALEKESTDMYRVDLFSRRISRHKNHDEVKSLTNEIGILRMLMEEKLRACESDTELMLQSSSISDLVMKIDKVVTSCHKLEKNLGQHLDKAVLMQFSSEIVGLIAETVTNKEEIQKVADGIIKILGNTEGS